MGAVLGRILNHVEGDAGINGLDAQKDVHIGIVSDDSFDYNQSNA
jgi:hypothetical protein